MDMKPENPPQPSILECLDAINNHRVNARAIAGIMEMARFVTVEEVDLKTVGNAAAIIVFELDESARWMRVLEEKLRL